VPWVQRLVQRLVRQREENQGLLSGGVLVVLSEQLLEVIKGQPTGKQFIMMMITVIIMITANIKGSINIKRSIITITISQ
jgi:hypothetical protein